MKKNLLLLFCILVLWPGGCKKSGEIEQTFSITGKWGVSHTRTYDDGHTEYLYIVYVFSGNENSGTISMEGPGSGGVFSGSYQVNGNLVSFQYTHGRAFYFSSTFFSGELNPHSHKIQGSLYGYTTIFSDVETNWTGEFVAVKQNEDSM